MTRCSFWKRLAVVCCLLYGGGVAGVFLLRLLLPGLPFVALVNALLLLAFAPLLVTLPLALFIRSRAALVGGLLVLALFAATYGGLFLPRLSSAPAGDPLTVMTFNVAHYDEQLAAVIAAQEADVVALQEVGPGAADLLRDDLGERYPYLVLDAAEASTGLLSRYPIVEQAWFTPGGEGRAALHAQLDVDGAPVHVLAIHPMPPAFAWCGAWPTPCGLRNDEPERQVAAVAGLAARLEGPVVVLGDFNLAEGAPAHRALSRVLVDAYRQAGWGLGLTFPYRLSVGGVRIPGPLVRLDHVFASNHLYPERATVGCGGGADHCYLVVRYVMV